ncbi:hypothetical protein MD484_g4713, partial [Candolleomyces efflorescens]
MPRLGSMNGILSRLRFSVFSRPIFSSSLSSPSTSPSLPRRAVATAAGSRDDLFNYTSGRWVYNEALRLKERKVVFDADELRRLAAESVGQSLTDVCDLSKLAEGSLNRTFVITLRDGRQILARIPYPAFVPSIYAVASEVATTEYLRSCGIPAPEIYGYSADSDNPAGAPYIFTDFVKGSKLSEVLPSLSNQENNSVFRQLVELESRMMSLSFPAGGSLYFANDLEKVAPGQGVPLKDKRFCVGPDTSLSLWFGRRRLLDVDRGPYQDGRAALEAGANKEIAYLRKFGQPLLPMRRERRRSYKYQPQSPWLHVENLEQFLSITPSLVPRDPALSRFSIRHPDLRPDNILVSRSPGSGCKIVGLSDWKHASILPMFLLAGVPRALHVFGDIIPEPMAPPSLPDDFDKLSEPQQAREKRLYILALVHYHYVTNTKEYNQPHFAALTDPLHALRRRLFQYGGAPWEGESADLKMALIEASKRWDEFTAGRVACPLEFDADDLHDMAALGKDLDSETRGFEMIQSMGGVGEEGWVPFEDYNFSASFLKEIKQGAIETAQSAEDREDIVHWPWDDMDEVVYT